MKHSKHRIHIDAATKNAVKQLQARHPLATISAVVTHAVNDAVNPVSGAERARQFLRQAGGDHVVAAELLLQYLHLKYKNFCCNREPGRREYNRIRKCLHNTQRCTSK